MNLNSIMQSAFSDMPMKTYPLFYKGDDVEYIVWQYLDERPSVNADDIDVYDITDVRVHLFTPRNPKKYKKQVRNRLRRSGFVILSTNEFYEDDTRYYHITVDASIEGVIDDTEV